MAIMAISVTPIGTGSPSVGRYVAEAVRVIEDSGLKYEPRAMHTEMEGDLAALLAIVPRIHQACFGLGALRVSTVIKIDDRHDAPSSIAGKTRSVQQHLGRA